MGEQFFTLEVSKRVGVPLVVVTRPADTKGWISAHLTDSALSFWGEPMRIKNWPKFQHFTNRRPPWIKLYRDILDDDEWYQLPPNSAKILVSLWLLASEDTTKQGELPPAKKIAFRLRITEKSLESSISDLSHWLIQDDINVISPCHQLVPSETERETETEREGDTHKHVDIKPKGKRAIRDEDRPTEKHITFAKTLGIDPGPEWGKFKNYCLAHDKRYANFEAAFRNWLANAKDMKGGGR